MTTWTAQMDFGVVHPLIYFECRGGAGPIMETLPSIVDDPLFGAIEIAPIKDPAVRKQARDLLFSSHIQVVYLPILPTIVEDLGIASADPDARAVALERLRALIDEAIDFDSPLAMIGPPRDPGPSERAVTAERLAEDIQQLCDYAAAKSRRRLLHLTLENFDRDIEKKRLIGPTREAAALAEAVSRENFGLTIDLSHLPLLGETSAEALQIAAPHILHAHIGNCVIDHADSPLYGDFHPRFGHPLGRNDLPEVVDYLHQLDAIDYWNRVRARLGSTPILSMELRAFPDDSPSAILANGKRTFIRAWHAAHQIGA
jgi:sugar phosphate isomerase/epimerase